MYLVFYIRWQINVHEITGTKATMAKKTSGGEN